jgi:hypothetical protein
MIGGRARSLAGAPVGVESAWSDYEVGRRPRLSARLTSAL